jgi:hypothetical protein
MTVITRTGLARLQAFAKAGGKVIFVGKTPSLILDKTFMDAKEKPDLSFATLIESSGDITPAVIAALPKPDVKLDSEFPRLTYTHRQWTDGDMYYFFNESNKAESRVATIAGHGKAQAWDLATGEIHPMAGATAVADGVQVPLVLGPYEAKVIVVGPLPKAVAAAEPSFVDGKELASLDGDWALDLNGKQVTSALKPWEALGTSGFAGPGTYHRQFTAPVTPAGKHVYLDIGEVNDYAKVTLNGKELGAHSWQPYRWDLTSALKPGTNDLVIEVHAVAAGGRGGQGGAPPAAATPPPVAAAPVVSAGLASMPSTDGPMAAGAAAINGTVAPTPAPGAAAGTAAAAAGARRRTGAAAGAPPAGAVGGGGGAGRASGPPPASGLLGPVRLVAY